MRAARERAAIERGVSDYLINVIPNEVRDLGFVATTPTPTSFGTARSTSKSATPEPRKA
jgi:hypothetical protein